MAEQLYNAEYLLNLKFLKHLKFIYLQILYSLKYRVTDKIRQIVWFNMTVLQIIMLSKNNHHTLFLFKITMNLKEAAKKI